MNDDEEDPDQVDPVLQKIFVSHEENQMSLYSHLFGIRTAGGGKIRGPEGRDPRTLEDTEMQPLFKRGI